MALVSLGTINIDRGINDDFYSEIILYPLMTDSGPNGYTLVSSLEELRLKFNPSHITTNWMCAESLLALGYRLLIAKLTTIEDNLSLRIFESYEVKKIKDSYYKVVDSELDPYTGLIHQELEQVVEDETIYKVPITYSHPKRYFDYSRINLPWKQGNRDSLILPNGFTYSIKLPIPEKFYVGDYIFLTLKHDTDRTSSGQIHRFIGFGEENDFSEVITSEVATDIKYIPIKKDEEYRSKEAIINDIIDALNHFGLYNTYEENSYLFFNSFFPIQYNTTCKYSRIEEGNIVSDFKYILDNPSGKYDIICEAADSHKLIDFYSKESLSTDNISIECVKNFDGNFSVFINVLDKSGNSVKSEYFRISMNKNSNIFVENVLKSSEIVDCVWYKEGDISGFFKMKPRQDTSKISIQDMIDNFAALPTLESGDFDIIVDGDLGEGIQKHMYDKYKDVFCVKLFHLCTRNDIKDENGKIISSEFVIPPNRRYGIQYCNGYFSIGSVIFPLWMGILSLIKTSGRFYGDINIEFKYDETLNVDDNESILVSVKNDEYLCKIKSDGYRMMIDSSPIYMGKSTYSLDLIWVLTMIRNRIIPSIDPNIAQEDFIRTFNSRVKAFLNGKTTRVSGIVITGYKKVDRTLKLEIVVIHDSTFVDSVTLEITLKIN